MYPNFLSNYLFKTTMRAVAVLSILAVMSCSKTSTNDISPQVPLSERQYSLEVSKALYSAIQLGNYNLKATKKFLIENVTQHKNDVIRNSANSLLSNERFNKLFVSSSVPNARSSADNVEMLDLQAIKKEINSPSVPIGVRKKLLQFSHQLEVVKGDLHTKNVTGANDVKNAIGIETAKFENEIKSDQTLSSEEKSMIFSFTIPIYDNLNNIKNMLTMSNPNGRSMCFFCSIINIFVTVVVAVIIVTVAMVGILAVGSALLGLTIASGSYATMGLIGSAIGIIGGIGYAIDDTCIFISDYGQELYTPNGFLGLGSGQC